jgi:hypothetical protein
MKLSPIAFFAYKRPEHTRKSLESLSRNEGAESSDLFIFCEGAKRFEDEEAVRQVRQVVRSKQWCKNVHIIEHEKNMGCANSIIYGVTKICEEYGSVIVVEDDLLLSPYFLHYMNSALELYKNEQKVMQISGHMFPLKFTSSQEDSIFLPFTTSWGWATWQRAWHHFDPEIKGYEQLKLNKNNRDKFDLNGSFAYFDMLESQLTGKIDAWDIRWYLSTFMLDGLTLFPKKSLVANIGFDGSGTHCGKSSSLDGEMTQYKILSMPKTVKLNYKEVNIVFKYLRSLNQPPSLLRRIKNKFIRFLHQN